VGELAFVGGIPIHELTPQQATLEDAFMELTHDDVEFVPRSTAAAGVGQAA
jgi:ABC-2 type transport system ATP-binding protein